MNFFRFLCACLVLVLALAYPLQTKTVCTCLLAACTTTKIKIFGVFIPVRGIFALWYFLFSVWQLALAFDCFSAAHIATYFVLHYTCSTVCTIAINYFLGVKLQIRGFAALWKFLLCFLVLALVHCLCF